MKILFGVFDWGLGHATRDTPIIEELLKKHEVHILSTGRALKILKGYFGKKCKYFDVPSIYVPYPKSGFFVTKFTFSIPKMLSSLAKARAHSRKIIEENKYDRVISDCRYDVYDKKDNSFLINHQLKFKAPFSSFEYITEKFLDIVMRKYKIIIVPDFPGRPLTVDLSFNKRFKGRVEYIGILSRIKKQKLKKDIDFFIPISGPEPQRTIFEKKVLKQIEKLKGRIVLVSGTPELKNKKQKQNIEINSYFDLKKQEEIMNRAKFIVSRDGYTTVMEMVELDKKNALFIPSPGQTEQEYLADLYEQEKLFHHTHQNKMNLVEDIKDSRIFKGYKPKWKTKDSVKKFIELISS